MSNAVPNKVPLGGRSHLTEVELKVLETLDSLNNSKGLPVVEISELSQSSGLNDSDEVLRALYTLEGRSLVTPDPEGNFTSNKWKISPTGKKALTFIFSDA